MGKSSISRSFLIEQSTGTLSIVTNRYKYIQPSTGPAMEENTDIELGNSPMPQLYNLKQDENERSNLAKKLAKKAKSLSRKMEDAVSKP